MKIINPYTSNLDSKIFESLQATLESEHVGFARLCVNKNSIESAKSVLAKFNSKTHFIQVGIGGSHLGAEMLIECLAPQMKNQFTFINNIDSDSLKLQLQSIDLKNALIYVVSKSGGTAETNAALAILVNELKLIGVKDKDFHNYFVFCTDPYKSELRTIAKEYNIECLEIPSNVGGRFSVLTHVGIFPALFAHINLDEIFNGANEQYKNLESICLLAQTLIDFYHKGYDQTVLMSYSSLFRSFNDWFVQLWAESLGKKRESDLKHVGLTPVIAYGATDQHSQVQLFTQGPQNKFFMFLEIENKHNDFELKSNFSTPALQKLSRYTLNQLMKAELEGTIKAFEVAKRPHIRLSIESRTAYELGQLIMFFEILTAAVGIGLMVDPFNQPGVEAGKVFAFEWLEKLS